MESESNLKERRMSTAILPAGLLVGTLDIIAAIVLTIIRGGTVMRLFQFIASGVFGNEAFSGGTLYAVYGLIFHYCIAMVWTIIYFLLAGKIAASQRHKVVAGVLYGVLVWIVMNLVVLPLSRTPDIPFNLTSAIIGIVVLILAIGLPLSHLANRFFSGGKASQG
jgi:uncharacterized membrane protein YagU involved in acid resistance